MFNIKYNFLVLIQIVLNAINAILLIKVFGVSAQVDSYLLAVSIMTTIQLVQLVFFEQFMLFYTDLKKKSIEDSHKFYNSTLFWSVILGIFTVIILYLFRFAIFKTFAFSIDKQRLDYLNHISLILFSGALFVPINALNEKLFNAESKFSIPYILSSLPNFFIVVAQIWIFLLHKNQIMYLAYGQTFGWALASVIGTILIAKKVIPFKFVFYHSEIKPLVKNSFTTQLGSNIYTILVPICLNNFLVSMPKGSVSCFYYARKIIETLKLLTIGPSARILRTNLTTSWVNNNAKEIKINIVKFLKGSVLLMIMGIILAFICVPVFLNLISMGKLTQNEITNINLIFLSLCPWYLVVLMEIPYTIVVFIAKKSRIPMFTNSLFIIFFIILTLSLAKKTEIYSISIAAFIAQLSNYYIYKYYANKLIKENCEESI